MASNPFQQLDVFWNISRKNKKLKDCYRLLYHKELWKKHILTFIQTLILMKKLSTISLKDYDMVHTASPQSDKRQKQVN